MRPKNFSRAAVRFTARTMPYLAAVELRVELSAALEELAVEVDFRRAVLIQHQRESDSRKVRVDLEALPKPAAAVPTRRLAGVEAGFDRQPFAVVQVVGSERRIVARRWGGAPLSFRQCDSHG